MFGVNFFFLPFLCIYVLVWKEYKWSDFGFVDKKKKESNETSHHIYNYMIL